MVRMMMTRGKGRKEAMMKTIPKTMTMTISMMMSET